MKPLKIDPSKRYFKFLTNPDYFGTEDDWNGDPPIPIDQKGGVITDPKEKNFRNIGTDNSGIYFTDIENCGYYYTYGDYYVEIFPIPGIAVKPCKDEDGRGYYTYKVRYGPVQKATAKFICWLVQNGADVTKGGCSLVYKTIVFLEEHPNNKWARKLFQQMMVQLSSENEHRTLYNECWKGASKILGGGIYQDLYEMLKDSRFDLSAHGTGFGLIEEFCHRYDSGAYVDYLGECIHQYLLRLRVEHPAVYAITIHQFPDYTKYVDSAKDPEGFTYLIPVYHGPYDEYRFKKHHQ